MSRLLTAALALVLVWPVAAQDPEQPNGFFGVSIGDVGKILVIEAVYEGTSAERYGVKPGDLILAIDGEPPKSTQAMIEKVTTKPAGTAFRFRLLRGDQVREVDVKLGKRPDSMVGTAHELTAAEKERLEFLSAVQTQADPLAVVYARTIGNVRTDKPASALAAVYRAMIASERHLAAPGEQKGWDARLRRAEWLLRLTRGGLVPQNTGRVERDDAALRGRIAALAGQLGHSRWAVRERASQGLLRIGPPALPALSRMGREATDPEAAWRARHLVSRIEAQQSARNRRWGPAILAVQRVDAGALTLDARLGPPLRAGATYRAVVLRETAKEGWQRRGAVVLKGLQGAGAARLIEGSCRPGDRLGYLAPAVEAPAPLAD